MASVLCAYTGISLESAESLLIYMCWNVSSILSSVHSSLHLRGLFLVIHEAALGHVLGHHEISCPQLQATHLSQCKILPLLCSVTLD